MRATNARLQERAIRGRGPLLQERILRAIRVPVPFAAAGAWRARERAALDSAAYHSRLAAAPTGLLKFTHLGSLMNDTSSRRHFETEGDAYARYRPTYPPSLATLLAGLAPDRERAVDVGCGNGQLSVLLAEHFDAVDACDVSRDQVANAIPHPKVRYSVAPAEALPVDAAGASLVTAAQAAHWFDLPAFYGEVRRIGKPGAVLALISYMNAEVEGPLAKRFESFYARDIADFWPPERLIVERGYVDLAFPFDELNAPVMSIERDWNLSSLLGYVETWSATRRARAAGEAARVEAFIADAQGLWGDPKIRRRATWPVRLRLGKL